MTGENIFIDELQSSFDRNVFVMMRYGRSRQFEELETTIRTSLRRFGLVARFARDHALSDDLWENIRLYMMGCRYGIAVFDEIDERYFNPNVSLELGYMYSLNRRCLLLKDRRMPRLPTDVCGKIYRDFDTYGILATVGAEVAAWCERDLGLTAFDERRSTSSGRSERLIYDSIQDERFASWTVVDTTRMYSQHIKIVELPRTSAPGAERVIELRADGTETVGMNKVVDILSGRLAVIYRAISSSAPVLNLSFQAIPMLADTEGHSLVEVGAERHAEPHNVFSPYRHRHYVQHDEIGDGQWHQASLAFDFRRTPGSAYALCSVRINEGCPKPGGGCLQVRSVQLFESHERRNVNHLSA